MPKLRSIDGGKEQRAKTLSQAVVLECRKCGSRTLIETRTGVLIGASGRIVHKGTPVLVCAHCKQGAWP